ncbi:MAG: DUF4097 family beta strand repeat protein [Clostridia bacterium]|nr:DUF4097 family beta strand repeat protein [Clostridia bacterium]
MKAKNVIMMILIFLGIVLAVVGGVIFTVSMSKNGWDFSSISNVVYIKKTFEFGEKDGLLTLESFEFDITTSDVEITFTDGDKIEVETYQRSKRNGVEISNTTQNFENGVYKIIEKQKEGVVFTVDFGKTPKSIVKIPKNVNYNCRFNITTGKLTIGKDGENYSFGKDLILDSSTGEITVLANIEVGGDFSAKLTTGKISLAKVKANQVKIKTTTGGVQLNGNVECANFYAETSTGEIFGEKAIKTNGFYVEVSTGDTWFKEEVLATDMSVSATTGKVRFDKITLDGQSAEFEVSTGDLILGFSGKKDDYSFEIEQSTGKCNISSYERGNKRVEIESSTGDVTITFWGETAL